MDAVASKMTNKEKNKQTMSASGLETAQSPNKIPAAYRRRCKKRYDPHSQRNKTSTFSIPEKTENKSVGSTLKRTALNMPALTEPNSFSVIPWRVRTHPSPNAKAINLTMTITVSVPKGLNQCAGEVTIAHRGLVEPASWPQPGLY